MYKVQLKIVVSFFGGLGGWLNFSICNQPVVSLDR